MKESEEHWLAKLRQVESDLTDALNKRTEAELSAADLLKKLDRAKRLSEALLELLDNRNERIAELNKEVLDLNKSCQDAHNAATHMIDHAVAQSRQHAKYKLLGFIEKPNGRTVYDIAPTNGRAVYVREHA